MTEVQAAELIGLYVLGVVIGVAVIGIVERARRR